MDGIVNATIIRPDERVIIGNHLFCALSFRLSAYQFYLAANGVTQFILTHHGTKNIRIAFSPVAERKQIASFLDKKTKQIDALITSSSLAKTSAATKPPPPSPPAYTTRRLRDVPAGQKEHPQEPAAVEVLGRVGTGVDDRPGRSDCQSTAAIGTESGSMRRGMKGHAARLGDRGIKTRLVSQYAAPATLAVCADASRL